MLVHFKGAFIPQNAELVTQESISTQTSLGLNLITYLFRHTTLQHVELLLLLLIFNSASCCGLITISGNALFLFIHHVMNCSMFEVNTCNKL